MTSGSPFSHRKFRLQAIALMFSAMALLAMPAEADDRLSLFAQNVTTHVVLHELGHAVFREFGIPILANEEAMADSFASTFITEHMREAARVIILDRARSWKYEDSEVRPEDYDHKGEHALDIRRAYQAACLLYGADPAERNDVREWAGFSDKDADDCSDTAPDQVEGWSQVLARHLLPPGQASKNVELIFGEGPMKEQIVASGMMGRLADIARRFDWPQPITLHVDHCNRGAFWSRDDRTIMLCDDYVMRFVKQGEALSTE